MSILHGEQEEEEEEEQEEGGRTRPRPRHVDLQVGRVYLPVQFSTIMTVQRLGLCVIMISVCLDFIFKCTALPAYR